MLISIMLGLFGFGVKDKFCKEILAMEHHLKIVTFNIGENIQKNKILGSESAFVSKCQANYPKYSGWSEYVLSQCTSNAAIWLAKQKPDLIGLQEVVQTYLYEMLDVINNDTEKTYESIGSGPVRFIYNVETLGTGYLLSPPKLYMIEPKRELIVVWFSKVQILAINLHAPHQVNLKEEILNTLNKVQIYVNPKRIIIVGDFNDGYYESLTQINFKGKILRQHGNPPKSCCADSNYSTIGDYIFDSEYMKGGFYGIPKDAYDILMSDHYPVVYYES